MCKPFPVYLDSVGLSWDRTICCCVVHSDIGMKLTTFLFRAARLSADADAIMNPHKLPRRIKNKLVGRLLGRVGFWRVLWK